MEKLTAREYECLNRASLGENMKETAADLYLSVNTIHTHRVRACRKLNAKNTLHAVRIAIQEGIIKLES